MCAGYRGKELFSNSWEELSLEEHMEFYLRKGIDRKEAMKLVAKDRGITKREVYQRLI